jgi:hypothetical protein
METLIGRKVLLVAGNLEDARLAAPPGSRFFGGGFSPSCRASVDIPRLFDADAAMYAESAAKIWECKDSYFDIAPARVMEIVYNAAYRAWANSFAISASDKRKTKQTVAGFMGRIMASIAANDIGGYMSYAEADEIVSMIQNNAKQTGNCVLSMARALETMVNRGSGPWNKKMPACTAFTAKGRWAAYMAAAALGLPLYLVEPAGWARDLMKACKSAGIPLSATAAGYMDGLDMQDGAAFFRTTNTEALSKFRALCMETHGREFATGLRRESPDQLDEREALVLDEGRWLEWELPAELDLKPARVTLEGRSGERALLTEARKKMAIEADGLDGLEEEASR